MTSTQDQEKISFSMLWICSRKWKAKLIVLKYFVTKASKFCLKKINSFIVIISFSANLEKSNRNSQASPPLKNDFLYAFFFSPPPPPPAPTRKLAERFLIKYPLVAKELRDSFWVNPFTVRLRGLPLTSKIV